MASAVATLRPLAAVSSRNLGRAITQANDRDATLLTHAHEIQICLRMTSAELQAAPLSKLAHNEEGARTGLRQAAWARTQLDDVIRATQPMLATEAGRPAARRAPPHRRPDRHPRPLAYPGFTSIGHLTVLGYDIVKL